MLNQPSLFCAMLFLNKIITADEADLLVKKLASQEVPATWTGVVEQFEYIIGRKLNE